MFLVIMVFVALHLDIPMNWIISDALIRLVMNGVLVLSLVPMLRAGIGINFGLSVGVIAGLIGMCISVNFTIRGLWGLFAGMLFAIPVAVVLGFVYAMILNRVRGKEEITATFVGFSFIPLMNFFWATVPFSNPAMLWPIGGKGMRPVIGLKSYFAKTLNDLWMVNIGGVNIKGISIGGINMGGVSTGGLNVPLGLLLFFFILCLLMALFFKTSFGRATIAVGENEQYASLAGVNIVRVRTVAIILSTIIAAIGICVYAQSYGFLELYDAPLMMAFPAASAILVGGSMGRKTDIVHVILGTFLFQTTYLISGPIANELMVSEVAEIFRLMVTNGIILYALLYEGGIGRNLHGKGSY
ncbi:MAG: ABC transporter permease [Desulfamplus sp.]|nr:ABC transporter permease [Desulfamplus sp.]